MTSATTREVEWFRTAVPGLPPVAPPNGPFYRVTDDLAELAQSRTQLFLALISTVESSASKTGPRQRDHEIAAMVMWRLGAASRPHVSQDQLDEAVEAVVARVRGVPELPNHDGRWAMVRPIAVEFPAPYQLLAVGDAMTAAGATNVRSVRYSVREYL